MVASLICSLHLHSETFIRSESMETQSYSPKVEYNTDDITVKLNYDDESNELFLCFYNNLDYIQYIPKDFIDLFQLNEKGIYIIVNDEISIKDSDDNYLDYIIKRIDIDIKNISIKDCYELKPKASFETKRVKLDKIVEINNLKDKTIKLQYDGRFGKSNVLIITI